MSSTTAHEPYVATAPRAKSSLIWIVVAAIVGFGVAFTIQQFRLSNLQRDVASVSTAWRIAQLEATLGGAVIDAQAGRLEDARLQASAFYTGLQRDLLPRLDQPQRDSLRTLLVTRDSVITALARSDPGSAGALEAMLVRARSTMRAVSGDTATSASGG